jgi:universal stress protein A
MIPKKILFCTDFSDNSLPARQCALDYAKAFDAELTIIHVINSTQLGYSSLGDGIPFDIRSVIEGIQESAERGLALRAGECRREIGNVTTHCTLGNPAQEIVSYANEHGMELIVMGTHGWTGFKHLIMGSTAENVVRSAMCPVLTVRSAQPR